MKIKEKLFLDREGLTEHGPINIVIFGDSVSHGAVNGYMDYENVYWNRLKKMLNRVRDYVPVNMINASIGGTTALQSVARLEKQVLIHQPDLVIVCFGLNDVNRSLEDYLAALRQIFTKCRETGCEVIFMTPNMLNTHVAEDTPIKHWEYAHKTAKAQNEGRMDLFMSSATALARELEIPVCDCYAKWKELSKTRDVTMLLANRINHPLPEMHALFAEALYEILIGEPPAAGEGEDAMFCG
ncbi:MAG: SGNH/GDSL hydrolase family protein [Clostridia bacterium]|nr:SGNH/GDSL hydrolase family protein [Clostridia bacterium]